MKEQNALRIKHQLYFDIEPLLTAEEVGGWDNIHKMRLGAGVTYCPQTCEMRIFEEPQAAELVRRLNAADLVVGYNCRRFAFTVLKTYGPLTVKRSRCLDLMLELKKVQGRHLSFWALLSAPLASRGCLKQTNSWNLSRPARRPNLRNSACKKFLALSASTDTRCATGSCMTMIASTSGSR